MKDTIIFILLAGLIIGWGMFFVERSSKSRIVNTVTDSIVYVHDTIRPKQPKPILIKGDIDTVTTIDTAAVDSVNRAMADSISFYKYLLANFQLTYSDSIQEMNVKIDVLRKTGLFTPHYNPIAFLSKEIYHTSYVDNERWITALLGAGYQKRDSSHFYFFLDARIRLNAGLYLKPRISTDGIGAEIEYKIY
jgi:hypothetical protein